MKKVMMIIGSVFLGSISGVRAADVAPGETVLISGTNAVVRPELSGSVIYDEELPFEIVGTSGSLLYRGILQNRVVRSDADETLDFYYRIRDTQGGLNGVLDAMSTSGFAGWDMDVDFRLDSLGSVGPSIATRSGDGDIVDFFFGVTPVFSSTESFFVFVKTDATDFDDGGLTTLGLRSGFAATLDTVVPVPEPSSLVMLTLAIASSLRPKRLRRM